MQLTFVTDMLGAQWRFYLAIVLVFFLLACAGPQQQSAGRYPVAHDGPPRDRSSKPAKEPVPKPEPLSRYGNHSPYDVNGKVYYVLPSSQGYRDRGIASWYGRKFHGHKTSSGEIYDMFQFSAAHRELPLPTYVEVTNLDNGRSVVVRVNDRGPFHGNRLLDLSFAAAEKLDMISSGTASVEVRAIGVLAAEQTVGKVWLQVGAYSDRRAAERVQRQLRNNQLGPVTLSRLRQDNRLLWRVRIGPFVEESAIRQADQQIQRLGLGRSVRVGESE